MSYKPSVQVFVRNDGSSLDYVGKSVAGLLRNDFNVGMYGICKPLPDQKYMRGVEVGMVYGLPVDLIWMSRYPLRIAGLVCEQEVTGEEVMHVNVVKPNEVWVPSVFAANEYRKAGVSGNLVLFPHGAKDLPMVGSKKVFNKVLMVFNSYKRNNFHVKRKGIFEVLEAFKDLPDIKLLLRTDKQPYYLKYLSKMKNVEFVGRVDSLKDLYSEVDAVLCPSFSEGFGLVGLEALVAGVPLISTKTGNDYLSEQVSYIHIDIPFDSMEIKKSVKMLYNKIDSYKRLAIEQAPVIYEKNKWYNYKSVAVNRIKALIGEKYGN